MSDLEKEIIAPEKAEKLTESQKKTLDKQMELKKAKVVDGKLAKFETRSSFQNQYSGVESILPEQFMFGMDDKRRQEVAAKIKRDQEEERRPVRGIFRNFETPGGEIKFPYRAYKNDPLIFVRLRDGQETTIPLGVARHIRHRLETPVRGWAVDENNIATHSVARKMVKRCTFEYTDSFDPRDDEFRQKQAASVAEDVISRNVGTIGGR